MKETLQIFFKEHFSSQKTLLLGYSGGPDSKALLHLLKDYKNIHVAHVDHGWRETSAKEACALQDEVKKLQKPFHLKTLKMDRQDEDAARNERLQFFEELVKKYDMQGVLLAHHADDLRETVLKRVLEGAPLYRLHGMRSFQKIGDLAIFRPLLPFSKKEILTYLEEENLSYLFDKTNSDPRFLRARLRGEIFPYLTKSFGKNFQKNLSLLGMRSLEMAAYLEKKAKPLKKLEGPFGKALLLSKDMERIEARFLIQKEVGCLPRGSLDALLDHLFLGKPSFTVSSKLFLYRSWIFFLKPHKTLEVKMMASKTFVGSCWQDVFLGRATFTLPVDDYEILLPEIGAPYGSASYRRHLSKNHVPRFLRPIIPTINKDGLIVADFLSGKSKYIKKSGDFIKFVLTVS